jgi:sulfatase modifying factor 1
MGCSPQVDNECTDLEGPPHEVIITRGFWIGQTEVTQEAYQRITGNNPSNFQGVKLPVENIHWEEALGYCKSLGGRLPTEAEWEYAALAGTNKSRYGEIAQITWYDSNSGHRTHEVGQKDANAWGLYDTLGNVWEWVADWYAPYSATVQRDPHGPATSHYRTLRGGAWYDMPRYVRASYRVGVAPRFSINAGLRCVMK